MGILRSYLSLAHAGWVLVREGVLSELPSDAMPPSAKFAHKVAGVIARKQSKDREQSERLSIALNKLGLNLANSWQHALM